MDPNTQTPPATPPAATPPAGTEPQKFSTVIPTEFHDRAYLKDFMEKPVGPDTFQELFKKLDGAEQLIGRKTIGIPAADAPQEEWDQYYAKVRPSDPKGYEILKAEGEQGDEKVEEALRSLFHKTGLTPKQAKELQGGYSELLKGISAEAKTKAAAAEAEFAKLTQDTFGAEKDKVLERTQQMLREYAPESAKKFLGDLDNKALVVLSAAMNAIHTKFLSEDGGMKPGGAPAAASKEALRAELHTLLRSPEFTDVMNPQNMAAQQKANELATRIANLGA
jgi:hypothetical protein